MKERQFNNEKFLYRPNLYKKMPRAYKCLHCDGILLNLSTLKDSLHKPIKILKTHACTLSNTPYTCNHVKKKKHLIAFLKIKCIDRRGLSCSSYYEPSTVFTSRSLAQLIL